MSRLQTGDQDPGARESAHGGSLITLRALVPPQFGLQGLTVPVYRDQYLYILLSIALQFMTAQEKYHITNHSIIHIFKT